MEIDTGRIGIKMEIRCAVAGDSLMIYQLVKSVFDEFIAPDYSPLGVESFYQVVNETSISKRIQGSMDPCLVAVAEHQIVGVLELRSQNHIRLLFVDKKHHKKGVAKALFQSAFADWKGEITVNSSSYAVGIYERFGFEKISGELIKDGITFIPMIMEKK